MTYELLVICKTVWSKRSSKSLGVRMFLHDGVCSQSSSHAYIIGNIYSAEMIFLSKRYAGKQEVKVI